MSDYVMWGGGLFLLALVLVAIELFIPSGGVIGVAAALAVIGGIVAFFMESPLWGVSGLLVAAVATPIVINFALKVLPHTPIGRRLFLGESEEDVQRRESAESRRLEEERALVGASGVARTDLRPVGIAEIEGTRIEVLAESGMIEAGTRVRVTSVHGNQIKVRAVS